MAATVQIHEKNGAGEAPTNKTGATVRYKNADDPNVDLNNPLVKPTSGQEYSFQKWLRLHIASGAFTQISNLRAYTDGANGLGTGVKLWWKTDSAYPESGQTAPRVPVESNDPPQYESANMVDAFTYTSASPLDLDALNAGPFDSTGVPKDIGDYLISVMEVETTASGGVTPSETITVAWDEI